MADIFDQLLVETKRQFPKSYFLHLPLFPKGKLIIRKTSPLDKTDHDLPEDKINGWGFVPIGFGNRRRCRTHANHYFFKSNKSLCGKVVLDARDRRDYKFTSSKNIMSFLLCKRCLYFIRTMNQTKRLAKN